MKAIWNGQIIAESKETIVVENNHYFPAHAVNKIYLKASDNNTTCPWKGTASYHSIEVAGQINKNAAWYYPKPKDAANHIAGYIAFWKGVIISE